MDFRIEEVGNVLHCQVACQLCVVFEIGFQVSDMQIVDRPVYLATHHNGVVHPSGGSGEILQGSQVEGGGTEVGAETNTVQEFPVIQPFLIVEGKVKEQVR